MSDVIREGNFVHIGRGWVNLGQVQRFEYLPNNRVRIWWSDGEPEDLAVDGRIPTERYYIVPAQPGFELLSYWPDPDESEGEELLKRAPVVAWRIEEDQTKDHYGDNNMIAISIGETSAEEAVNMRLAVRHPDGLVSHYRDRQMWKSLEEWRVWAKEDWRRADRRKTQSRGS